MDLAIWMGIFYKAQNRDEIRLEFGDTWKPLKALAYKIRQRNVAGNNSADVEDQLPQ